MKKIEPKLELSGLNSESEHIRKEIIKELSRFDISQNQSKTYIFLSKSGPKTASEIAKSLNLPRTETYNILNQLQSKRIVIANLTKPIKFEAVDIKNAVEILVENERNHIDRLIETTSEILNLWNMLPESVPIDKLLVGNRFQLIQGKNSILGKIKELTQTAKKEILIFGSESDFIRFYHTNFFEMIKKTKVDLKIVTSYSKNTKYIFDQIPSEMIKKFNGVMDEDLFFIIKDHSETIFFMKTNQDDDYILALWTESKTLINSLKLSFSLVWAKSNYLNASDDLKTETEDSMNSSIKELEQEKLIVESLKKHVSKTKTKPKSRFDRNK